MERTLPSNAACSHIQQQIGLMLDEATGLNKKSALIVYLKLQLPAMDLPENV